MLVDADVETAELVALTDLSASAVLPAKRDPLTGAEEEGEVDAIDEDEDEDEDEEVAAVEDVVAVVALAVAIDEDDDEDEGDDEEDVAGAVVDEVAVFDFDAVDEAVVDGGLVAAAAVDVGAEEMSALGSAR